MFPVARHAGDRVCAKLLPVAELGGDTQRITHGNAE